jgi:hypothetical protein
MIKHLRAPLLAGFIACCPMPAFSQALAPAFESGDIALLQPEAEISGRIGGDAEALVSYIKALADACLEEAEKHRRMAGATGLLVVAVRPGYRSRAWLEFGRNSVDPAIVLGLRKRVEAVRPLRVHEGVISFSVSFDLWGGGEPVASPEKPLVMPAEWEAAVGKLGRPAETESVLDVVWPPEG